MQKKQARYMKQATEEYVKAGAYIQKQKKKKMHCDQNKQVTSILCV
jgi:ribosomal protein L27